MLVHVLGNSTNMDQLMKILKKKIILIEDTCRSFLVQNIKINF